MIMKSIVIMKFVEVLLLDELHDHDDVESVKTTTPERARLA